ncbi:hypothetical protein BKA70DRAFT_1234305 [Coprinopsis sp. MPI-PUGE-AT-0042]|nr:hypothetical protein BKA70DRAFT_1234305 [Coprinopsis sp. MPI-PUGE-AT-0042]
MSLHLHWTYQARTPGTWCINLGETCRVSPWVTEIAYSGELISRVCAVVKESLNWELFTKTEWNMAQPMLTWLSTSALLNSTSGAPMVTSDQTLVHLINVSLILGDSQSTANNGFCTDSESQLQEMESQRAEIANLRQELNVLSTKLLKKDNDMNEEREKMLRSISKSFARSWQSIRRPSAGLMGRCFKFAFDPCSPMQSKSEIGSRME